MPIITYIYHFEFKGFLAITTLRTKKGRTFRHISKIKAY